MHFSSILRMFVTTCLACATIVATLSMERPALGAPMQSVVGNLSDFYTTGNLGTLDIEKGGTTMRFTFGSSMTINGRPWMSGGMRTEDWGGSIPSALKLHCTLIRVYYSAMGAGQKVATALKTISSGGSRYFC